MNSCPGHLAQQSEETIMAKERAAWLGEEISV